MIHQLLTTTIMKTVTNKPISAQQLKALHATFHRIGMDDEARHSCIYEFTSGRTQSSRELTMHEAQQLLERLNPTDDKTRAMQLEEARNVFRDIYHLSFLIPQLNQGFTSDSEEEYRMNVAKLNIWARKYSKARKDVTAMKLWELQDTKKQLEAWMRREERKAK
nr:MAG TPA: Protein of unknown function (DUF1018) [Caudoviricetes sp.]